MRNRYANRQRAAALAGLLALALVAGTGHAWAQDDEDEPLDTRLFRSFMKEMGFTRGGQDIEYRERAPLVVPPTRNLPPPQAEGPAAKNPAWPKDPDVTRRKQASAAEKAKLYSSAEEQARVLRPDELKAQGPAGVSTSTATGASGNEAMRPLSPSELQGTATKSWWQDIFSNIGPSRQESAPFKGEPPRTTMTAPPPGYQTPSPSYPYGVGVQRGGDAAKPSTVESRMEPSRGN